MKYTTEQFRKIHKYCYRMNKACNNKDINKVSDYFNHLKYHVMTGGVNIDEILARISESSKKIESLPRDINDKINNLKNDVDQVEIVKSDLASKTKDLAASNLELKNKTAEYNKEVTKAKNLTETNNRLDVEKKALEVSTNKLGEQVRSLELLNKKLKEDKEVLLPIIERINTITEGNYMKELESIAKDPNIGKGFSELLSIINKVIDTNKSELKNLSDIHTKLINDKDSLISRKDAELTLLKQTNETDKKNIIALESELSKLKENIALKENIISENIQKIESNNQLIEKMRTQLNIYEKNVLQLKTQHDEDKAKYEKDIDKLSKAINEYLSRVESIKNEAIGTANPRQKNNP